MTETANERDALKRGPWLWGLFYVNQEDPRLWVLQRYGVGWTINWAHLQARRQAALLIVTVAFVSLALAGLVGGVTWRQLHGAVLYVVLSSVAALAVIGVSGVGVGLNRQSLAWLGYGVLALLIGFGLQGIMNGGASLLLRLDPKHLTWQHHLYFGPMAGLCQTLGKIATLKLMFAVYGPPDSVKPAVRMGLLVGLGFTLAELALLGIGMMFQSQPVMLAMAVWERASASLFHVYSTAVVALGLVLRRYGWVALVIGLHGALDWFAGSAPSSFAMPVVQIELVVFLMAAMMWCIFLGVYRKSKALE